MKFSVLLSVYKNESSTFLQEALSSIWDQQLVKPSEIVIVEDGPLTADLYLILDEWQLKLNSNLKRVPLKINMGLGRALNEGLNHCSYEWIFRMDTDDISTFDRFQKQVDFIERNPSIDIFSSQIIEFDNNISNRTGTRAVPLNHKEIIRFSKWRSPFNHMAVAYKKSAVQSVGGYKHHLLMEDYNLWLRMLNSGCRSANLPNTLVFVRAGNEMIERRRGLKYIYSEWQLFQLKKEIKYQRKSTALCIFLVRSIPRTLPSGLLSEIYTNLRKS